MTDTSKRELIEEAAKAMYFEDCGVAALEDDAEPFREMARVAFAVFEQAHTPTRTVIQITPEAVQREYELRNGVTPTDDERGVLGTAIWSELAGSDISMNSVFLDRLTNTLVGVVFDSGFRRTAVQEPSAEEHVFEVGGASYELCRTCGLADFQHEPQDEHPCGDWPAPCNCNDPETHDQSEPHGEPTDAQVLAALNAHYRVRLAQFEAMPGDPEVEGDAHSLEEYSSKSIDRMRAALRAAAAVQEGENRG